MILPGKSGCILSSTNKRLLKNSDSSKPWQRNKVESTSKYLGQIEEMNMTPKTLHNFADNKGLKGNSPQGNYTMKISTITMQRK
jgi:hypothetical protein